MRAWPFITLLQGHEVKAPPTCSAWASIVSPSSISSFVGGTSVSFAPAQARVRETGESAYRLGGISSNNAMSFEKEAQTALGSVLPLGEGADDLVKLRSRFDLEMDFVVLLVDHTDLNLLSQLRFHFHGDSIRQGFGATARVGFLVGSRLVRAVLGGMRSIRHLEDEVICC